MSYAAQLYRWQKNKTLLRISTVEKGIGHQVHLGNIIFTDEQGKSFLFYDLDQKKNYNFSINEIDSIEPYEKVKSTPFIKQPAKIEVFQDDIREEIVGLIKELPTKELYALLPLLQLLAKKKSCN